MKTFQMNRPPSSLAIADRAQTSAGKGNRERNAREEVGSVCWRLDTKPALRNGSILENSRLRHTDMGLQVQQQSVEGLERISRVFLHWQVYTRQVTYRFDGLL